MWTNVVVFLAEAPKGPREFAQRRWDADPPEMLAERAMEALDFALRLRVVRAALDVPDTLPPKLLLEFRLPSPRHILPSLVGQIAPRRGQHLDLRRALRPHLHQEAMRLKRQKVEQILIVTDEEENTSPFFANVYETYCSELSIAPIE